MASSSSAFADDDAADSFSSSFPLPRPPTPTDTLFYAIYPDAASSAAAAASSLAALHSRLLALLRSSISGDYVFPHSPPSLFLPSPSLPCLLCRSPPLPHLHGVFRFADSLFDEWLIVAVLLAVSRTLPDLAVRVWDSDGEFLLAEAAYAIPRWLSPSSACHRVFIRNGDIHIVPRTLFPSPPSLPDAISAVLDDSAETRASDAVQSAIRRRVNGLPENAMSNMHRAAVVVPLPVARLLKSDPGLVALAVAAFYERDVESMKHAARMEKFLLAGAELPEMVRVSVMVSKVMYAQLVQQVFQAPRQYPMPARDGNCTLETWNEAELGMKIACGFEMMYQEHRLAAEEGRGSAWDTFWKCLETSGCFEGLLPGSKDHKRAMEETSDYFKRTGCFLSARDALSAPVRRIDEILSAPCSGDEFRNDDVPPSDDDSWLHSAEDEINATILERQKEMEDYVVENKRKNSAKNSLGSAADSMPSDFNLGDITDSMKEFVQKVSSFEGAEVPESRNLETVNLDVDQFFKAMESAFAGPQQDTLDSLKIESSPSEMDFDGSESGSDFYEEHGDGESVDNFMKAYSDALNKEISSTTLGRSFIRAQPPNIYEGPSKSTEDTDEELDPVDVDVNLVESFLSSFSSQQGLPGPASNLLGLMGVKVPPEDK